MSVNNKRTKCSHHALLTILHLCVDKHLSAHNNPPYSVDYCCGMNDVVIGNDLKHLTV